MSHPVPCVLHLDLDAFFASVEQRDKPSLRGRPVVVGGLGGRGVVATASYEARRDGVHSAMPTAQARRRCPHAAFLVPRFWAYRVASDQVMGLLRQMSPLVEPLSLDEAFLDLVPGGLASEDPAQMTALGERLRADVHEATGLTASVGIARTKLVAKIASELCKPDGLRVVPVGAESALLEPLPVERLWGVGEVTALRLRRSGISTIGDLRRQTEQDAVGLLGEAHGRTLHRLSRGIDDRRVRPDRETKSVSAEDTFDRDLTTNSAMQAELDLLSARVGARLRGTSSAGRTVTIKVRTPDFTTTSRSATLSGPTDDTRVIARTARALLAKLAPTASARLLGVGVSGLTGWAQAQLSLDEPAADIAGPTANAQGAALSRDTGPSVPRSPTWWPGQDVTHAVHGPGWVWGAGLGRVSVRFETAATGPGPVRTLAADDPALAPVHPSGATETAPPAPITLP